MASLLGQYFSRIIGSQEDIASEGLVYILNASATAKKVLSGLYYSQTGLTIDNINYITQSSGDEKERPDISGIDPNRAEKVIIEAKFWSSLTKNQPNKYLKRLVDDSVLLFICPTLRMDSLGDEIEARLRSAGIKYDLSNRVYKTDHNKYILIANWADILATLRNSLSDGDERLLVSDVDQLIGFCEVIDNYSFMPLRDGDLDPSIARRSNSYVDLVDKIADRLKADYGSTMSGYRSTPQKYGYTKYMTIGKYGIALDVNTKMWELRADTPLWLNWQYGGKSWSQPEELKSRLKNITTHLNIRTYQGINNNYLFMALVPKIGVVEDVIISDITHSIKTIFNGLENV
ncbi:MAG: hypothetical protein FWH12_03755 [Treponema sp.]|nr:hypothetical protein [Treponema sp.]